MRFLFDAKSIIVNLHRRDNINKRQQQQQKKKENANAIPSTYGIYDVLGKAMMILYIFYPHTFCECVTKSVGFVFFSDIIV